jgi:pyruvate/2-oxoglutarate dehydrogenase complex dihydrolipoamide acyltransferase (E2) component
MQTVSVTYRGAEDPRDRTTRYRIGEYLLPKGVAVEVPEDIAAQLQETKGHNFEIGKQERNISSAARELAEEKDVDLAKIEGDGPISINDVREVVEAREADAAESTD